jgi:hypothetical protein
MPTPRAERETAAAAERLQTQIKASLTAVADHVVGDANELEACADRLERAARDLVVALRELAKQRNRLSTDD